MAGNCDHDGRLLAQADDLPWAEPLQAPADDPAWSREPDLFRPRLEDTIDPSHPLVRRIQPLPRAALIDGVGHCRPG